MRLIDFIKSLFGREGNTIETPENIPIQPQLISTTEEALKASEGNINLQKTKTMKTSELMMKFLKQQGFMPETLDNGNIVFKYQMATFLYIENDEDPSFFQLSMPGIFDVTDDNRDAVLIAANQVNKSYKVAKVIVTNDDVWILTECMLDSTPELDDIVPRFLDILSGARREFYEQIQ